MPGRNVVLATGEIYHIFNRGNAYRPTFLNIRDYQRFLKTLTFYRHLSLPLRLSKYLLLSQEKRILLEDKLTEKDKSLVDIFCFCLMPNHYHLLLRQKEKEGISKYMSQLQNSYTRYLNVKRKQVGSIFQGHFKAVRIETDEQLIHLSRYIHLNPYSSFVVKSIERLKTYPWSSLPDYSNDGKHSFLKKRLILDFFKNIEDYQKFVFDQADYQKNLEKIKHLTWEKK
ncbi:transposase [Candidatus Microgenomates bacterium]|nr:transposase [Candidatus Microgenomates bacterium]